MVYHSWHRNLNVPDFSEYFSNVKEMLALADILSVHVPLHHDTVRLVGKRWIRDLKPGAIIINSACRKVIREHHLIPPNVFLLVTEFFLYKMEDNVSAFTGVAFHCYEGSVLYQDHHSRSSVFCQ